MAIVNSSATRNTQTGNTEMEVYYRVHWSDCPAFCAENAISTPWGCHGDDEFEPAVGYSCVNSPGSLIEYFSNRGEPEATETVVVFTGDFRSLGDDFEYLVVPESVVLETTYGKLTETFRRGETIADAIYRVCEENGIDSETARCIVSHDIDSAEAIAAICSDIKSFCVAKNAEWNEEAE